MWFVLQKTTLLCVTSLSWLVHAKRAWDSRKKGVLVSTSLCSAASVNLWRNYHPDCLRRTVDIVVARITAVYYGLCFVRRWNRLDRVDRVVDIAHVACTNACYWLSSVIFCQYENIWLFFHTLFHMCVYKVQSRLSA